jgi:NADPH:quinone reductase
MTQTTDDTISAIQIEAFGTPQEMQLKTLPLPQPAAGEVRLKLTAIGINLIDTYHRSGLYPLPLPTGLGCEGAGIVEAVGDGVSDVKIGDRAAFAMAIGAYAEAIVLPAAALVKIPDSVSDEQAAAVLLKGMTVDYLFNETFPLQGGETVLFHAAAGGVGLLACQWAKHLGVNLIGTASTAEKCALAESHGAANCLLSQDDALAVKLKEAAPAGFPVVYDSVGKDSYRLSLDALAPRGMFVSFGNASGPIDAVSPADLAAAGSVFFTRPTLATFMAQPGWMQTSAARLFDLVGQGVLQVEINQTYPLADAARAHIDLEARKTTGCSLLLP